MLLPAPASDVSPKQLAVFKERHRDALRSFRHHLETSLVDIALVEDEQARRRKLDQLKDGLVLQIEELRVRLHERGWRTDPMGTVLQVMSPAGAPALAAMTGHPAVAAAGLPGLLLAGYLAARRNKSGLRSSPLAFAASAQGEFGGALGSR